MDEARDEAIQTTKQLSALRQIIAAIAHLHNKQFECAITLAGAAEGQLPETTTQYLFRLLKKAVAQDELNLVRDWLKHQSGPEKATISEFEVALMIARAIHKFVAVYKSSHPKFEEFEKWAVEKKHLPRLLTEDGRSN